MNRALTLKFSRWLGFATLLLALAAPAIAQEGESPADSQTGWVFRWINFAIVLSLLIWGFRKAAPSFRARQNEIAGKIAEGTRARETAEARRREVEEKLKKNNIVSNKRKILELIDEVMLSLAEGKKFKN